MKHEGVQPNYVTMVGVLNACAHGGSVEEGFNNLDNMKARHGIEPREVAEKMRMGANAVVCGGRKVGGKEPWNDGVYAVLSNIYVAAGMWEEVEKLRKVMEEERRVANIPGYSLSTRDLRQCV